MSRRGVSTRSVYLQPVTPGDYDTLYLRKAQRSCLEELDAAVLGEEVVALRSTAFIAPGDIDRWVGLLQPHLRSTQDRGVLSDFGCGVGLVGREVARRLDLRLAGIDFSSVAIDLAQALIPPDDDPAPTFQVAEFEQSALGEASSAAAISIDALYLAADPRAALREVCRVLRPGAPFLATIYMDGAEPDWRRFFAEAGLRVINWTDVSRLWREGMQQKHLRRWRARHRIVGELGTVGEAEVGVSARVLGLLGDESYLKDMNRTEVLAVRP